MLIITAFVVCVFVVIVIEYLWDAKRVFHPESGPELEKWVQHRLFKILQGKAGQMAGGMRRSATIKKMSAKKREPVDKCAKYLLNKSPYIRYDCYLSEGLPIDTGVIEGACRHLVKDRMEITGAKWTLQGAEAVLRLRALRSSKTLMSTGNFTKNANIKGTIKICMKTKLSPPLLILSHMTIAKNSK